MRTHAFTYTHPYIPTPTRMHTHPHSLTRQQIHTQQSLTHTKHNIFSKVPVKSKSNNVSKVPSHSHEYTPLLSHLYLKLGPVTYNIKKKDQEPLHYFQTDMITPCQRASPPVAFGQHAFILASLDAKDASHQCTQQKGSGVTDLSNDKLVMSEA